MVPSEPAFCTHCGASFPPDAAYCSRCGTAVEHGGTGDGASGGRAGSDAEEAFRDRVEDYLVYGWSIERDFGDRVVLVYRGFGSLLAHLLLVFLTGGVGNVVYAWYCYGPGASRRELRADGTDRSLDDSGGRVGGIDLPAVAGVAVGVLVVVAAASGLAYGIVLPTVVALVTLFVVLAARFVARPERFRSPTTFGRKRTLREQAVGAVPDPCADCGGAIRDGVERAFAERTYVAGVPVRTHESGSNRYCRACATGDGDAAADGAAERDRDRPREFA